jgi:hypothetical protein
VAILPFVITTSYVKCETKLAIELIMKMHGLWQWMLDGNMVTMAAIVDGSELAWKLTQVSASIKFVDPMALNPLTG